MVSSCSFLHASPSSLGYPEFSFCSRRWVIRATDSPCAPRAPEPPVPKASVPGPRHTGSVISPLLPWPLLQRPCGRFDGKTGRGCLPPVSAVRQLARGTWRCSMSMFSQVSRLCPPFGNSTGGRWRRECDIPLNRQSRGQRRRKEVDVTGHQFWL